MRKSLYTIAILLFLVCFSIDTVVAQSRVARTEFICYDRREDANNDNRTQIDKYLDISPVLQFENGAGPVRAVYEQQFQVPASWNDYNAYLHMENVGGNYTIFVNGKQISSPIDMLTPTDLFISPHLVQGLNTMAVVIVDEAYMSQLDENINQPKREQFENSYIFAQRKLGVYDFDVRLLPDSLNRFAQLHLDVEVDNSFSTDEVVEIGYDIYAPDGKLMEYSVNDISLTGFSRDTLTFEPYIYNSNPNRWSPSNPKLYDLTLYIKRSGILWEYIPLKVGFVEYGFNDNGQITAFGEPLTLRMENYNAAADRATTEREIRAIKARGINCLCPDYPQPRWFYDACDRIGMYVIDCAAISSPSACDDRSMGGTPANAPWLVDEYCSRVETMYRRARYHACIIAFSLSNTDSGNGYNMYKAYQLLKSYNDPRAIIYKGADGEWNTDIE